MREKPSRITEMMVKNRYQHRQEVLLFLQNNVSRQNWELLLPASGRGHETYIARSAGETYFVKLGARAAHYQVLASLDLTPRVIEAGCLHDGTSILVQPYVDGRNPSWHDFRCYLEKIAFVVKQTHHSLRLQAVLPEAASPDYQALGMAALSRIQQKWELYRSQVPAVAEYVDERLAMLEREIQGFVGAGLAASHNDICNANWLITAEEKIYLVDLEAMSLDDPAHDLGALLWWYYPPELRRPFLAAAGYAYDEAFKRRMRVRMALHCLDIILPRAQSFDHFDAGAFPEWLTDFRAIAAGKENPRGYDDD